MSTARILFAESFDIGSDLAVAAAESAGVCIRPRVRTVTDRATGQRTCVPIPCGSTRESQCGPCATKARRVRMQQCREGWHLTDDPLLHDHADQDDDKQNGEDDGKDHDQDDADDQDDDELEDGTAEAGRGRRVRSTRRLSGFPDLPTVPMDTGTVGREFVDERSGRVFRPSMFLTLTLPSYGKVIEGTGVPRHPDGYDYRRAAMDAMLWPRLLDRFWQNLRRCAGYQVQYFSAVEAQRRLAAHLHAAIRGSIPRTTLRAVIRATYVTAWWPPFDQVVYAGTRVPIFDREAGRYVDPDTGALLPTWAEAARHLDEPAHVVTFGAQVDIKGLIGGTVDSDRAVRYLCKYLTKNVSDTYTAKHPNAKTAAAYERHVDRLHHEVRWLPCSPGCANWLRYGVEPRKPGPGLVPGMCPSRAHERENVGLGGRRVLVSRGWTGKTLTEHRADRREVVAQVLAAAGMDQLDANRMAADRTMPDGTPRYVWEDTDPDDTTYVAVIAASLRQAQQWRTQYEHAKTIAAQRGSPPVHANSATSDVIAV